MQKTTASIETIYKPGRFSQYFVWLEKLFKSIILELKVQVEVLVSIFEEWSSNIHTLTISASACTMCMCLYAQTHREKGNISVEFDN